MGYENKPEEQGEEPQTKTAMSKEKSESKIGIAEKKKHSQFSDYF